MTSEQRMLRAIARGVPHPEQLAQYALDHPDTRLRDQITQCCADWRQRIAGEQDGALQGIFGRILKDIEKILEEDNSGS